MKATSLRATRARQRWPLWSYGSFGLVGLFSCLILYLSFARKAPPTKPQPLEIAQEGSFFVGGRNVRSEALSTIPTLSPSGTITVEQMYVRYQIPVDSKRMPVTLVHGSSLTGKTWETTPDGRMGWDEYFLRKGHATYVVDQVSRGRSSADLSIINSVRIGKTSPDLAPQVVYVGHEMAWVAFRFGPAYGKVYPGMQFPLDAQAQFWKQFVPDWSPTLPTPNPTVKDLSKLAIQLNGTVLVSHSQSGGWPFQAAALNTTGIAGIISIEPADCPPPFAELGPYLRIPTLILFGDYVDLNSPWAARMKGCREFVSRVRAAGGWSEFVVLPDVGIKGNSHMLMQDRNSLEIAALLDTWIHENVERKLR